LLALPLLFALTLGALSLLVTWRVLLEGYEKPEDLLREEGLFKQLKRALIENAPARFHTPRPIMETSLIAPYLPSSRLLIRLISRAPP
jgi:hypothetical protein